MNHAAKGSELEGRTRRALELHGFDVLPETLVGHKKVDLLFEDRRIGARRVIAVECKHYAQALSQEDVSSIYANYLPLLEARHADELLIVTLNGLSPSASAFVRDARFVSHVTISELQLSVMNFTSYLAGLCKQFSADGLASYYVPLRNTEGDDLEALVDKWADGDAIYPIAILGSYGLGKTTFARRMAHVFAERALASPMARVPVLVRLGDISSEQSLEGLLGKVFTAHNVVRNYSFDLFMQLNAEGRFVVILDGFDEMKHTLSWEDFRFNFRQLNRLVTGDSRVLLLGRPTAFLSEDEQRQALHGIRLHEGRELRDSDWPDYRELHVSPFDRDQVQEFLLLYLTHKNEQAEKQGKYGAVRPVSPLLLQDLGSKQFADIARRPVQLKMLADILPQWRGDITTLTVSLLYSVFIDLIIERDQEKLTRRVFGGRERRQFAKSVAVWLWRNRSEMSVSAAAIPAELLEPFKRKNVDLERVRRDLVAACFLERKIDDSLFFPHRSFQEFLVAEAIVDELSAGSISVAAADVVIDKEIASFIEGMVTAKRVITWQPVLMKHHGMISERFARILLSDHDYPNWCALNPDLGQLPWCLLLATVACRTHRLQREPERMLREALGHRRQTSLALGLDVPLELLVVMCTLLLYPNYATEADVVRALDGLTKIGTFRKERPHKKTEQIFEPSSTARDVIGKVVIAKRGRSIELGGIYPVLWRELRNYCWIRDWVAGGTVRIPDGELPVHIEVSPGATTLIRDFQDVYLRKPQATRIPDELRRSGRT